MVSKIAYAVDYHPKRQSPVLLEFANRISQTKMGKKGGITFDDPEYYVMEHIVSDEAAAVGLGLQRHVHRNAEEVAQILGKPLEYVQQKLIELGDSGAAFFQKEDGADKYWLEVWVPGHMEAIINHPVNGLKYPEIGIAFDAYGKKRAPAAAGVIPMGMAPMRVIPIESAIMADSHHASYEEVSHYLNENTIFSVSDCSCRTVRESMGEGCGHLKEDMCIQMGHGAEYYIRTGRGRQITREEAFEIIKRAEENGLLHEIPNLDGSGKTHAICNCCGCGCLALRNASMYQNPDFSRSNYRAKVDPLKCVACGECVENCPVNALRLGQKLCSTVELTKMPLHLDTPSNTKWSLEHWNPDYRTNRKVVMESGTSPCKSKCPAHISVQGYVKMAAQGRFRDALELIKLENPFPAVCGHVCPRYCEQACTRGKLDEAVAVDDIKRFIAEQDMKSEQRYVPKKKHDFSDKKIAIIGAGPAGLSCAYYLAIDNYDVTVFEKEKQLGGMLTWGIPNFRLERDVINSEIDVLKELGVKFQTGVEIGKDLTLEQLRLQGFKGFYLAIGAQAGRKLGIEGEEAADVIGGVDFLRRVNLSEEKLLHGKTLVIGGGNVAIDVARTAVRAGGKDVAMFCLEQREEMPALPEEIHEALSEGISIENGWGPKRIVVENGKVKGVEFKCCTRVFDENHRFSPQFDENQTRFVEAEHVLTSVGQAIQWGSLLQGSKVELNRNNTVKADPITFQTAEADIFVGGDALTGPKFAIDAIAQGKEGAISLHRHVQHNQSLTLGRLLRDYQPLDQENLDLAGFDMLPRQKVEEVAGEDSRETFRDLRKSLTLEQIQKEAMRCLSCGAVQVDTYQCIGCGQCTVRCRFEAITLERVTDVSGVHISKLKPIVVKNLLKNKVGTAVHSLKKMVSGAE
jgi:NADPH-dependent glutamate synthase beta subunit-like oxidoreductase/NAD-dependent dihydropyrimidine dehydrogenase PreA subunit